MSDKLRDERRRPFYMVDNDIIDTYGKQIGVYGIAVYNLIARYADANGANAFPSFTTITKKLGIGRHKVAETIQLLVDVGLIRRENRTDSAGDKATNLYTLVDLGGGSPRELPGSPSEPQVVPHGNQGGSPRELYKDTNKKTPLKKKTTKRHSPSSDIAAGASSGDSPSTTGTTKPDGWGEVVKHYESNIGMFTSSLSEMVQAATVEYGSTFVVEAITEATRQNVRKWAYVEGILARWRANGRKPPKPTAKLPQVVRIYNQYTGQYEERRTS